METNNKDTKRAHSLYLAIESKDSNTSTQYKNLDIAGILATAFTYCYRGDSYLRVLVERLLDVVSDNCYRKFINSLMEKICVYIKTLTTGVEVVCDITDVEKYLIAVQDE